MQEDYSDILMEVAQSLDSYSGQYLKDNIKKNVSFYTNKYLCFKLESFSFSFWIDDAIVLFDYYTTNLSNLFIEH